MTSEIIISGFGGQGVMAIGKTLAEAALFEGLNVSWLPSYGPEMRGGTANCSVVMSTEPIGSPVVLEPNQLIAMSKPALLKFEDDVVQGGVILINSSIVELKVNRADVRACYVPCNELAAELGNSKVANMVMLGAYLEATGLLKVATIQAMLVRMFSGPKAKLINLNMEALKRGASCVDQCEQAALNNN